MKINGDESAWRLHSPIMAARLVDPLDEKVEVCQGCGNPVAMMCQKGTGWCSQVCQERAGEAPWKRDERRAG